MLFATTLVDLTLARVNLDIQAMAKIALVSYFHLTKTTKLSVKTRTTTTLRNELRPTTLFGEHVQHNLCLFTDFAVFLITHSHR